MVSQITCNKKHFDSLTGIRGVAACWIVFFHMVPYININDGTWYQSLLNKGYLAVDLFFILSGFVIYTNYANKLTNLASIKFFLIKRLARIYPLHIIVLICYLSLPLAIYFFSTRKIITENFSIESFFANVFLYQTWWTKNALTWNIPAWSISAEWFSYIAFCGFTFIYKKIQNIWFAVFLVFSICLSIAFLCFKMKYTSIGQNISEFGIYRCLFQFVLGNILALILFKHKVEIPVLVNVLFMSIVIFLLFEIYQGGLDYLMAPFAFCCLITVLVTTNWWIVKLFEFKVFMYLGKISYSIYMWHYLIRDYFKIIFLQKNLPFFEVHYVIIYFIFLIIVSDFSYKYFENFFQKKILEHFKN